MLTKKDKQAIIDNLKKVDVKKMEIDHENPAIVKWFRFGSYSGMQIAAEIIKAMPEKSYKKSKTP